MPNDQEREALIMLSKELDNFSIDIDSESIQTKVYEVGKSAGFENLKKWFQAQYEVLFGQEEGPRIGSFIKLYGKDQYSDLIKQALNGKFAKNS